MDKSLLFAGKADPGFPSTSPAPTNLAQILPLMITVSILEIGVHCRRTLCWLEILL